MTGFTAAQLYAIMPPFNQMSAMVAMLQREKDEMGEQFYLSLDRDRFEGAYAAQMSADLGKEVTAAEIKRLRTQVGYGHHRVALNQLWSGWQLAARELGALSDAG